MHDELEMFLLFHKIIPLQSKLRNRKQLNNTNLLEMGCLLKSMLLKLLFEISVEDNTILIAPNYITTVQSAALFSTFLVCLFLVL